MRKWPIATEALQTPIGSASRSEERKHYDHDVDAHCSEIWIASSIFANNGTSKSHVQKCQN